MPEEGVPSAFFSMISLVSIVMVGKKYVYKHF